jgi:hypothetical protein
VAYRGRAGQLWRDLSRYQLDGAELALLHEACQVQTELERIEAEIASSPVTVKGSRRQPIPNPLFDLADRKRLRLELLLRALALPLPGEKAGTYRRPAQRRKAKERLGVGGLREVPDGPSAS